MCMRLTRTAQWGEARGNFFWPWTVGAAERPFLHYFPSTGAYGLTTILTCLILRLPDRFSLRRAEQFQTRDRRVLTS